MSAPVLHVQKTPSDTWVIVHNLGRRPIVQVLDADDCVVVTAVIKLTPSYATIRFNVPTTGSVQLF